MQAVTMLNDLPTLDELEGNNFPQHGAGLPPGQADKYNKYVRPTHHMMPEAGMTQMNPPQQQIEPMAMEQYHPQHLHMQMNCIDIANHVKDCPICSKFYDNNKTVYIIVIIVLVMVCLLLLKRVLNV